MSLLPKQIPDQHVERQYLENLKELIAYGERDYNQKLAFRYRKDNTIIDVTFCQFAEDVYVVVLTTITIASLKVYDIVAVMTGGRDETSVLGFEMVNQQQRFQSYGHSSALAVVLFLFVLPLIVYNARSMAKQREIR